MRVQIKDRTILVNGKPIPLIGGEVHYWRLDPHQWETILDKVKGLGLEIISTYVPWDFHEVSARNYDFVGRTEPRRNLKAYLELLEKKGFWILIRPGPYIYSEWKNLGIPDRVTQYHRSHPELLKEASHYLESVFQIIHPHLMTQGGRILMIQPDNELDPMFYAYEEQLGLVGGEGVFQDFLKEKYRNIQKLNRAWGSRLKNFNQTKPTCDLVNYHDPFAWVRFLDFKEFIYWHVVQMGKKWCKEFRRLSPNMPLYLNVYPFYEIQPWKELAECADFSALDIYPTQEFHFEAEEHRDFLEKVRALRCSSPVPFIAEFQSGTWHGYHTRSGIYSPNHYRMTALSALLAGATGWSWYMLVNRDNWYLCPIDEWGQIRHELYDVFRDLVRVFKEVQPHRLEKMTEIGVSFYPMHFTTRAIPKDDALLKSLYDADVDYDFVDFEKEIPKKKLVFYSGASWLPRSIQKNLLAFVEKGGTLISFLNYPRQDERLKPLNLMGFAEPSSVFGEREGIGCEKFLEIKLGGTVCDIKSPFYIFDNPQGRPLQARVKKNINIAGQWSLSENKKYTIGYIQKKGKGLLVEVGTNPTSALLVGILNELKMRPFCRSTTPEIQTGTYRVKSRYTIFIVNSGEESKSARIEFLSRKSFFRQAVDLFSKKEYAFNVSNGISSLEVSLERKSGTVLAFDS